jgi:hypothetical protein
VGQEGLVLPTPILGSQESDRSSVLLTRLGEDSVAFAVTNCFGADTLTPISGIPRAIGSPSENMNSLQALEHGDFPIAYIVDGGTDSQLLLLYQVCQNGRSIT